jgi:hypothetical protein
VRVRLWDPLHWARGHGDPDAEDGKGATWHSGAALWSIDEPACATSPNPNSFSLV